MEESLLNAENLPSLDIETVGQANIKSPLEDVRFVDDSEKVVLYSHYDHLKKFIEKNEELPAFERAGPRRNICFKPSKLNCGIVTCGGLCPGLNDVIRTVALSLIWEYGVRKVYGFRYGYNGLTNNPYCEPFILTPELVEDIHLRGGDILSSSRGPQNVEEMVDNLVKRDISILFVIGGDGTLHGAAEMAQAIKRRNLKISIVGIPKTIDNDIYGVERTFGFSTAVEAARTAINVAHEEAKGAWDGVGLVKLMGRDSGFISAYATLANSDVNFCFIPEVPLVLDGEHGFLKSLEKRLDRKHHALIVVAEGVGQSLANQKDMSGNVKRQDIGILLKTKIVDYFKSIDKPLVLKYIDPSYTIRSCPANSFDSAFCLMLGQSAVHAGMAGKTNMIVGFWNRYFTHVPISLAVMERKKVNLQGDLWQTVVQTTGQAKKKPVRPF